VNKDEITADVAARLVAAQFPQWAALPVVPVMLRGWDNTTFRLGDELSIRLPNADRYAAQVGKEHRGLPVLARQLPLPNRR
jgi:aminoglycoside phosphotransferase (APT) family kinase protein